MAARIEALVSAAPISTGLIAALSQLRFIANPAAGYDRIDLDAARARDIRITNAPGANDACVADLAFGLLLAVARDIVNADRFVRSGDWPQGGYGSWMTRLSGRRIGILGLGRIGANIARRAAGFDMRIAYHNRHRREDAPYAYHDTLLSLAQASEILMVACPGGAGTRHLVNTEVLHALGAGGLVVNIARGTIIDEAALIAALQDGTIAGAGLDVFEREPLVPPALLSMPNVVLTPHRGGASFETWNETCDIVKANLWTFFRGQPPLNPIPPD